MVFVMHCGMAVTGPDVNKTDEFHKQYIVSDEQIKESQTMLTLHSKFINTEDINAVIIPRYTELPMEKVMMLERLVPDPKSP